ncbi:hypothetical protein [Rhizobium leguminosarum]|uniref:hypothetical protein n=1 Tax=Rhizobium leguminosarum TaxID=384 RepID=UPI001441AC1E|nr:hypothetical protein [Rhizobium leguminosarum]NKK30064.1 hypothetical protein [Rhizobium leguminosarum bv. viciae]NKK40161.1 hypothetical protein [Rhizobium leguminosarum bv. viciae]NKK64688.1 hypothetical protein [Rhizobium leguminosarum bv. viciae]NKL91893.1 hypothetical protein [Rhizobium leguminosarum bv. viciae]
MTSLKKGGYRFDMRRLCVATLVLGSVFFTARIAIRDSLTLGYAMMIPVYAFLSAVLEGSRVDKGRAWNIRAWGEAIVAVSGAAGVGYLGYRLWLLGY